MTLRIDLDVLQAILAGSTEVRRRMEIYEEDGETLFLELDDSSRIIEGQVNIDSGRSERRSFELTLENSDSFLDHDPNGFWYDKVIKIYRGVVFRNDRPDPKILIIRDQASFTVAPVLRQLGYTDITDRTGLVSTLDNLYDYDLIVCNSGNLALTTDESTLVQAANQAGFNILTIGSANTQTQLPDMISTTNAKAAGGWGVSQITNRDSPFAYGWSNYVLATGSVTDRVVATYPAGVYPAAFYNVGGTDTYPGLYYESPFGSRWFHYQPRVIPNEHVQVNKILATVMRWLYSYADERVYETQIGEFCIDNIESDDFPDQIKVSGRDYTKRLLNSLFRNTVTFIAGTPLDRLAKDLAANAQVYKTLLNTSGAALKSDVTFEKASSRWDAIAKVHNDAGFEVFFDPQGYLVTRPYLDPTTSPTSITLKTGGTDGNLASYSKKSTDAQMRNVVIVSGENQDDLAGGNIWQGIVENNQPDSPTRVDNIGPREYFHTSTMAKSNADCVKLATQMLKVMALEAFDLTFSSLVFPWLDAGEIASFIDPKAQSGEPTRYLLTSLAIPLTLGPMSGSGKRITLVGPETEAAAAVGTEGLGGVEV